MGCGGSRASAILQFTSEDSLRSIGPPTEIEVRCHVDFDGIVVASREASNLARSLGLELETGQSIFTLMTSTLADYHRRIFPALASSAVCERDKYDEVLASHGCRRIGLPLGSLQVVDAQIDVRLTPAGFDLRMRRVRKLALQPRFIDHGALASRLNVREGNAASVQVAILIVDIINSTEFMLTRGPHASLDVHVRLQREARHLLRSAYAPFISLYETAGDALIIVACSESALFAASVCSDVADFAADLRRETKDFVDLRYAASFGTVVASVIDSHVRLFGPPISIACRLQGHISPLQGTGNFASASVCEAFYLRLENEVSRAPTSRWTASLPARRQEAHLKGFGERVFYRAISLDDALGPRRAF